MPIAKSSQEIVRSIDFPHTRDDGGWRQEQHFSRASFTQTNSRIANTDASPVSR